MTMTRTHVFKGCMHRPFFIGQILPKGEITFLNNEVILDFFIHVK